jgi:ribosomal protein L11 methyltransferase
LRCPKGLDKKRAPESMTRRAEKKSEVSGGLLPPQEVDWLQLSLAGPLPALDAFSEFLCGLGAAGSIFSEDPQKRKDIEVITSFIPRDKNLSVNLESIQVFLKGLRELWPSGSVSELEARAVIEKDWLSEWKKSFKPSQVTSRIWIVPTWSEGSGELKPPKKPGQKGMIVIKLDPGMAFGTGIHATTRRCLELVESLVHLRSRSVLDVGTGTGILAMAAARLGARRVVAIDVDPEAVRTANENLKVNRLSSRVSLRRMRADPGIKPGWKKFDLILANLFSQELIRILDFLYNLLQNKANLVLAGILKDQEKEVLDVYLDQGFLLNQRFDDQGWITLLMEKT